MGQFTLLRTMNHRLSLYLLPKPGIVRLSPDLSWPRTGNALMTLHGHGPRKHPSPVMSPAGAAHIDPATSTSPNDHTSTSTAETVPLRVATWNCQGMQNNQHNITSLLTLEPPPDIVLLSETWTRRGDHLGRFPQTVHHTRILSPCVFNPEACLWSRGDLKAGTAVLISTTWAHPSTVKQWKGPAVPGYLDGVEIDTNSGGSLTILAAYVPPTYSDLKHASLIPRNYRDCHYTNREAHNRRGRLQWCTPRRTRR